MAIDPTLTTSAQPDVLVSRRGLVKLGILGPASLAACDDGSYGDVPVAKLASLLDGEIVDFEYPLGHPAFAVQLERPGLDGIGPDGDIVAFHRACPHQGCPLAEVDAAAAKVGPCSCHLSEFDLSDGGLQLTGRASTPLTQVLLEIRGDGVFAVGLRGIPFGEAFTVEEGR